MRFLSCLKATIQIQPTAGRYARMHGTAEMIWRDVHNTYDVPRGLTRLLPNTSTAHRAEWQHVHDVSCLRMRPS